MAGASETRLGLSNAQSAVPRPLPTGRSACVGAGDAESLPNVCEWRPRTLCFGFLADTTMLRWARERNKRSVQAIRVRARCRIKLVQKPCYEQSSTAEVPTGRKETKMESKGQAQTQTGSRSWTSKVPASTRLAGPPGRPPGLPSSSPVLSTSQAQSRQRNVPRFAYLHARLVRSYCTKGAKRLR
jgi:hypothetical protein